MNPLHALAKRRVLVTGGRDFQDHTLLEAVLMPLQPAALCQGEAKGLDRMAKLWCIRNSVPVESYPADWDKHGKAAGPIRNKQMLETFKPTLGVVFPGGRGTEHMKGLLLAAKVPTVLAHSVDSIEFVIEEE